MKKKEQRKLIKERASALDTSYCHDADKKIFKRLIALEEFKSSAFIFCFVSVEKEVNTKPIIEYCWSLGKRVAVPRCIAKGIMKIYEIKSFDELESGAYHIPEPKRECKLIAPSEIDFSVIPCLSCDKEGRRLGHGGGYYDRYLENSDFITVALCREKLLLNRVSTEPHDKSVDYVVTETTLYP